ncbi:MAG: Flp pilus assembly protein CpaB [Chloroflexi bacterium]|nr:Flp pilus assembly protein CpaB [Chloroflexota bacterium]MCI0576290.1 Flp pilus assembly protein CpaB [Chloroflexota bacterium]MCI0644514.1 Flp pilus assembly protein CpaB [Chloroflexota bacterium]MCI0728797.1 Flp pilus assembly protein CpaB [Chloroflexota bacterium]
MRSRTIILLILVLLVMVAGVVAVVFLASGGGPLAGLLGGEQQPPGQQAGQEPGRPTPTGTAQVQFVNVVVARVDLPVGQRITSDLIVIERRPADNVAVQALVTFDNPELVIGQIVRTKISRGQEILRPMLALNPSDLASIGSDLALYIEQGRVAVAFPINRFTGAAYALRPGDHVDVLMSLGLVDLDPEFNTALPNNAERVDLVALQEGRSFLFPVETQGRLEVIPVINLVAQISPGGGQLPLPQRVTQLTLQQLEVLWMGTWFDPGLDLQEFNADAVVATPIAAPPAQNQTGTEGQPAPVAAEPTKERPEDEPDLVILSMPVQDALVLKWALEVGIQIHLALRAQGDTSVFITTSVSLPQLVDQGGLVVPEPLDVGLEPRADQVPIPVIPPLPPTPVAPPAAP